MRCEANDRRDFLVFQQTGDKTLERKLSLCERTLINGRENFSGLDQGNQVLKEIGCDHLNLPQLSLFAESLEYWDAVCRADV
jgi:hypothetical protein